MYKAISFAIHIAVSLSICQSQMEVGSCSFYIKPVDTQCQTLLFQKCTYSVSCGQDCWEDVTSQAWGYCFYHCCEQSYGELTYQTLSNCNNDWTLAQKYQISAATIGSVAGFLLFVLFPKFTCAINWRRCCENFKLSWRRIFCCRQEIIQARNDGNQYSASSLNKLQEGWRIPQSLEARNWQKQICTICLSQDLNVQLRCAHYFHALCILSWEQKARTCPLCLLAFSSLNKVKKVCQKCFRQEREVTLAQFGMHQFCDDCQQKEKRDLAVEEEMHR